MDINNKKTNIVLLVYILFFFVNGNSLSSECNKQAHLIRNTMEEINNSIGKLSIQPVRVWGGDEEEDEHKFFRNVSWMTFENNRAIYISDRESHLIKVFDPDGRYIRTIGRRGKGPGDLYRPGIMALSPNGNLWVHESGSRRIQCFTPKGKNIRILKALNVSRMIGMTSKNEFVVYSRQDMFRTGTLVKILDNKAKELRKIGVYHDPYKRSGVSESLYFRVDNQDCIYAINMFAPIIRKYNTEGKLVIAVSIETPYDVPYQVKLNDKADEIERVNQKLMEFVRKNTGTKGGGGVISTQAKGKIFYSVIGGFAVDSKMRLFFVMEKKLKTPKQRKASGLTWVSGRGIIRDNMDLETLNQINVYRIVVLNPGGKVIASADLKSPSGSIYVNGDRLYNVDVYNQRIIEYRMKFKE